MASQPRLEQHLHSWSSLQPLNPTTHSAQPHSRLSPPQHSHPHHPLRSQVACGSGLVRIYDFLRSDEPSQYPKDRMDHTKKVSPSDVTTTALDKSDPVAGGWEGRGWVGGGWVGVEGRV